MGWFSDAFLWPKQLLSSEGRSGLWNDIKNGEGAAGMGSPLHGLSAGYEMTKLGSGYRAKQAYDRIQDGQNPLSSEFIRGTGHDQAHNIQDAFKENWPVLAFMAGGLLSGAEGAGGAGGAGAGGGGTVAPELAIGADGSLVAAGSEGSSALSAPAFAGGGSGGFSWGNLLQGGAGLLGAMGGGGQQQQSTVVQAPAQQQQDQSARIRLMQAVRLQALRQKPNKTLEEWAELQNAIENEGLLA